MVTTAVSVLTAVIVAAVSIPQIRSSAIREAQASLARSADSVADSLDRTSPAQRLPNRTQLKLADGTIEIYRLDSVSAIPTFVSDELLAQLLDTGTFSALVMGDRQRLIVEGRLLADGTALIFAEPLSSAAGSVGNDIWQLMIALAVGVAIAVFAGLLLARRLAKPLKVAAAAADQMATGRRDVSLQPSGPIEVAGVAEALNDLNAALNISEQRQREFLLSVSHELRTPLTSIRGYSEALADGIVPAEDLQHTAEVINAEADRLDRLVADLLDLARMGAREVQINTSEVDITALAHQAATVWGHRCGTEDVPFSAELIDEQILIDTDSVRVRQMIDNLLTNALRMTPPGQPIVLALTCTDDTVSVQVRDGGPGLTSDDLQVAFEPAELYSRYRGVRKVGSGVGLALVGRLAQRLGGKASAGHAPEGGACFTIELPRQRIASPAATAASKHH